MPAASPYWSAVILTGGRSSRMGRDKSRVTVGGTALLDRLLRAIPGEVPVVVVGPPPGSTSRPVIVTRERPVGGGPLAGLAAGIVRVATPVTVVAAVDLPFAGPALPELAELLLSQDQEVQAVVPLVGGFAQPLIAAYRTEPLRDALDSLGDPSGRSVRQVVEMLSVHLVPGDEVLLGDVDTPADLARARAIMASEEEAPMQEWLAQVSKGLEVAGDVDIDLVLDVARDAAHQVERPAAPLTTYLMGVAVGSGSDPVEVAALIRDLAAAWPDYAETDSAPVDG